MPPIVWSLLLMLHWLAAVLWVGGMFFAHFCLRPAALETLAPPQRLPLLEAALRRFLRWVGVAIVVLFVTGSALLLRVGFAFAPLGWHLMLMLGVTMALVYGYIVAVPFRRLRAHCAASEWPAAGAALNVIRRLVASNLALGVLTLAAAVSAR